MISDDDGVDNDMYNDYDDIDDFSPKFAIYHDTTQNIHDAADDDDVAAADADADDDVDNDDDDVDDDDDDDDNHLPL